MKYIMLETDEGAKLPILFPDALVHANVADLMKRLVSFQMKGATVEVVSAGFVSIVDASVHGESESLAGLAHNPVDGVRILAGESVMMIPDELLVRTFAKLAVEDSVLLGTRPSPDDRGHGYSVTPETTGSGDRPPPPRR